MTKAIKHKIPKIYPKPTDASPLSPFYSDPYTGYARAFPKWDQAQFPCGPLIPDGALGKRTPAEEGFLFVKEMKSGSTTLAGITARIGRNLAQRNFGGNATSSCTVRMVHTRARRYALRQLAKSFLWSVVREPVSRLFSKFFHFEVSRKGVNPNLAKFQTFISNNEINDYAYYFKTLSVRRQLNSYRTDMYETFLQDLLDGYNFIGIMERMDETLAVLQLLLGLETQDMLYLSTKTNGMYDRFRNDCVKIQPQKVTQLMKEYVYTPVFEAFTQGDVLVYQAVNKSLDLTIEQLGRPVVEKAVQRLQWAQQRAEEKCAGGTKFPCSNDGKVQDPNDCLFADVACGYKCLDDFGKSLSENQGFRSLIDSQLQ
ncbi:MAG: hypothetical protein SGBAC_001351 [Bacillariaceae sp.]